MPLSDKKKKPIDYFGLKNSEKMKDDITVKSDRYISHALGQALPTKFGS